MILYIMRSQKEDMKYKHGVGYVDSVLAHECAQVQEKSAFNVP
jgi:hypothetical protein